MVKIVPFETKYQKIFYDLNVEWISKYFVIEDADKEVLARPQQYILDKGGFIFVALLNSLPVGVCALLKRDDELQYELAKMAVSPSAQGKKIGLLLAEEVINHARKINATRLYLESNTKLIPAIQLWKKLGFKEIKGPKSPFERADIQMLLEL